MTDSEWLKEACLTARFSNDPSTQNGATVVSKDGVYLADGYNEFPPRIAKTEERWNNRNVKYGLVIHAEEYAIINAVRKGHNVEESTLYCPWAACRECAKKIIAYGIGRLVIHTECKLANDTHWKEEREAGLAMLQEAGIVIDDVTVIDGPKIRRAGKLWQS